jgi:hypothetical protein
MGRASDPEGKAAWLKRMDEGYPRTEIFAGFVNSKEFNDLCIAAGITRGTYTPPADGIINVFITRAFRLTLGRPNPSPEDRDFWFDALRSGRATGASFMRGLFFNDYTWHLLLNDVAFVNVLYDALLEREPNDNELEYFTDLMRNGVSRYMVFSSLANSEEFDRICRSYGVSRGTALTPTNYLPGRSTEVKIWNFIRAANVAGISNNPEHIAGIIGNMIIETEVHGNSVRCLCPFQQQLGDGTNKGLGILQWKGERRTALENYMWANGISQTQFTTEMNMHLNNVCGWWYGYNHSEAFFDRVLEVQINFMFHELRTTEQQYMEFINSPSNMSGVAGARAYSELFSALVVRPGAGTGDINNVQDPGVRAAMRASIYYGGAGALDRTSLDRLDSRRIEAERMYWHFLGAHN